MNSNADAAKVLASHTKDFNLESIYTSLIQAVEDGKQIIVQRLVQVIANEEGMFDVSICQDLCKAAIKFIVSKVKFGELVHDMLW